LFFLCPPCRVRCGAGFPACGRLSSRPWSPLPTALLHPIAAAKWSKPPGLPHRPPCGARSLAGHAASLGGGWLPTFPLCFSGAASFVGQAFQPAAGFPAGLGPLYPLPSFTQSPPPSGACRQACHAGGHAGRATQSRTAREPQRHPARTTARSTSTRPLSPHLRVLRVLRALCGLPSPCSLWFVFSVPSVSCPMWGRLSSLRPAFQPAWAPFTHGLSSTQSPRRPKWSKPPGLPCRRPRRQSHTIPTCAGAPNAIQPARLRTPPQPAPSFPISVSSVSSVVCFSPCPPCPLWFVFPVPSHPQSQRSPKLFPSPFQSLSNYPFLLLLLPSCMLKVKGAADALVGARTADGESPGQQRRRPQPLPSPDGGELRSLKPAAGGEQAGGGLLT
jgi:hypothetical protein